jgi:hypothetical protein
MISFGTDAGVDQLDHRKGIGDPVIKSPVGNGSFLDLFFDFDLFRLGGFFRGANHDESP